MRVAFAPFKVLAIEKLEQAKFGLLHLGRGGTAMHVRDWLSTGDDPGTLMEHGKKVRSPNLTTGIRQPRGDDHERRQTRIVRTQSITHPRPDARPLERGRTGVDADGRPEVVAVDVFHRANDADVVHHTPDVGEQIAHLGAGLAVPPKRPVGSLVKPVALTGFLVVILVEVRLWIEGVHVAHTASHEHENNPLGLGFEMRPPGREGIFPGRHQVRDQAGQDQASPDQRLDGLSPI